MSQQVITTPAPSIPRWRRRSFAGIALVALLAAGAGAAVGALLASDSSVTYRSARSARAPASVVTPPGYAETWDGNVLLAVVTAVPDGEARVVSLSPPVRQVISDAAQAAQGGTHVRAMPDTETLFGVLGRLAPADREVMLGLLPIGIAAEFDDFLNSLRSYS